MYLFANAVPAPSPSSGFGNSATGRSHANANRVETRSPGARRNVTHTAAADVGGVSRPPSFRGGVSRPPSSSSSAPVRSNASHCLHASDAFAGSYDAVETTTRGDEDAFDRDRDCDDASSTAMANPPCHARVGSNVPSTTPWACMWTPLARASPRRRTKSAWRNRASAGTRQVSRGPRVSTGATSTVARGFWKLSMMDTSRVRSPSFWATKRRMPTGRELSR